jgi:hypothetical protein
MSEKTRESRLPVFHDIKVSVNLGDHLGIQIIHDLLSPCDIFRFSFGFFGFFMKLGLRDRSQ